MPDGLFLPFLLPLPSVQPAPSRPQAPPTPNSQPPPTRDPPILRHNFTVCSPFNRGRILTLRQQCPCTSDCFACFTSSHGRLTPYGCCGKVYGYSTHSFLRARLLLRLLRQRPCPVSSVNSLYGYCGRVSGIRDRPAGARGRGLPVLTRQMTLLALNCFCLTAFLSIALRPLVLLARLTLSINTPLVGSPAPPSLDFWTPPTRLPPTPRHDFTLSFGMSGELISTCGSYSMCDIATACPPARSPDRRSSTNRRRDDQG